MQSEKHSLICSIFSILTILSSVIALQAQIATTNSKPIDKNQDWLSDLKSTFPEVDYSNLSFLEDDRKVKSKKYDRFKILNPEITKDSMDTCSCHWEDGLTALPTDKSQLIVVGKVTEARAHLSSQKRYVYSEFKIEVEKVYKNNLEQEFEDGKYIRAERDGGIVRFPSGFKTWLYISGQKMPKEGNRYLFFVTNEFPLYGYQKQDLSLLTAYELKDGLVLPLDYPNSGTHPIAIVYRGRKESVLFNDLEKALKQ